MTINVNNLQRFRFEEESTFGTEITIANFKDVPLVDGSAQLQLNQQMESPGHAQQYIDGYPTRIALPKTASFSCTIPLATLDTKPGNGVTAAQSPLGEMLKVAFGGEFRGAGTTVNDGTPSTTLNTLTSATGISEGGAIAMPTGDNGELEMREVKTKSGGDITVKHAFSNAPSNGGDVMSAATYYLTGQDGSEATSGQWALEGVETNDAWLVLGCQVDSIGINLPIGGLPTMNFAWKGVDWDIADGSATTMDLVSSGHLTAATYANTKSIVLADSEFRIGTVGSSTIGTLYHPSEINFDLNIQYVPQTTPAGINTVKQWLRLHQPPVISGSFVLPYEATTFRTSKDTPTIHSITLQIGTSATDGGIYIVVPNAQIVDVQPVDAGGIRSQRVSFVGRHDTDFSGSTSTRARSAFRIHLF